MIQKEGCGVGLEDGCCTLEGVDAFHLMLAWFTQEGEY